MISVITEYSLWWIILIIIISILFSFLLYKNDDSFSDVKKYTIILLKALRFSLAFILLFLLLKPLLKNTEKTIEKPIIAFLQDNSGSILLNNDSTDIRTNYLNNISKLSKDLGDDYDFVFYKFGKNINKTDSFNFDETETNIAKAISETNKLYSNRNIGAVIIASDGIYNDGSNPLFTDYSLEAPIYALTLGDTSVKKDIAIENIINNDIAYKGNFFAVKVFVSCKKLKNKTAKISILNSGKIIDYQNVKIDNDDCKKEINFRIEAKEKGIKRYTVVVDSIQGETNIENNRKDFVVEIIESKKKVLILANSPHPDISAIQKSLESSLLYDVDYKLAKENITNLKDYNLVIFHQLPSKKYDVANLIKELDNYNTALFFILGAQTDINKFNKINLGLNINTRPNSYEETTALFNEKFTIFNLSDGFKDFSENLTPLISNFGDFKLNKQSEVLLYQKIKNIETQKPLMVFTENVGKKYCVVSGEGIWRWRILDFYNNSSFDYFDEIINKTVQYLSLNVKNQPFIVENKVQYKSDENIYIIAKLYNKNLELINSPEISFTLNNSEGDVFNYTFEKYYDYYRINLGKLAIGDYKFSAKTSIGEEKFSKESMFSVIKSNNESLNTIANFDLLNKLSEKYSGKAYSYKNLKDLENEIKSNKNISSTAYYQSYLSDLINNIWIFIVLVLLVSFEWFYRKYLGSY
jgi:hypothetical protein